MCINNCSSCPYCGSANVYAEDANMYRCGACGRQIIMNVMKKTDIKPEDSLNLKKKQEGMMVDCDDNLQDGYDAMKFDVAEGYENIEASDKFDMINE